MEYVTLNTGTQMPILGFGVFQVDAAETERVVSDALEAGYRSPDTAASYFNEEAVGRAIAASGIPREELFITTKLWIQPPGEQHTHDAFAASLDKLGLDYVDLYLIHQPLGDYYSEWRALEAIHATGAARAIGVSNFLPDRLIDLMINSDVAPAVNQIEVNPFHQRHAYKNLMAAERVQIESWGPFAEGKNGLFSHPGLSDIAQRHGKSIGQVVLRWMIQRNVIVIPKTVNPDRMRENLDVFDFELSAADMQLIAALDTGKSQFFEHTDPEMVRWLNSRRAERDA